MTKRIRIENGRSLDLVTGEMHAITLLIGDGRILASGADAAQAQADQVLDARNGLVLPGLIDLACNLREPGLGLKGNIASETRAAAKGGYTTVCAMPDTSPVNDSGAVTAQIRDAALRQGATRVLPLGALTRGLLGEQLSDMAGLQKAGCVALSQGGQPIANARVLRRCMAYARTFNIPLFLQPENRALATDGCVHEGAIATRLGLPGIPEIAETIAVSELILLAEETGVRLHLSQITTARSVELLRWAQARGLPLTADVSMHHLVYTDEIIADFDSRFHCRPPLRSEQDRAALRAAVRDGLIQAIVSQHQPHDPAAKQAPFGESESGLSTVEVVLSLGLRLVAQGVLSLQTLLSRLTTGPAGVLGLPAPSLAVGSPADLFVLDTTQSWAVNAASLVSAGKHSPALGECLPGVVTFTLCGGQLSHFPSVSTKVEWYWSLSDESGPVGT